MSVRRQGGFPFSDAAIDVVAVVASADGVDAVGRFLAALPGDFPSAVVVIQHLPAGHPSRLAEVLAARTAMRVQWARSGEALLPRQVYVALPDRHVLVTARGTLALAQTPKVRHVRPAGDVQFSSLVGSCGPRAAAVVLSGADSDGADGVRYVKAGGGLVVAQDPATAGHPAMPEAAIATGCVDYVLPIDQIGPLLDWATRANHNRRQPEVEPAKHT